MGHNNHRAALLDIEAIKKEFSCTIFADSHGAFGEHLGAGLLYYSLTQLVRAQVGVCIGSGGGFVPMLIRRAQLDAGITPACTYLVDANLPDLGFGSPSQTGGWLTQENPFLRQEQDIAVLRMLSSDAARLFANHNLAVDYLHVDGDHSRAGVLDDFRAFAPIVSDTGVITMHDLRLQGVRDALATIELEFPQWDVLTFPEIGAGTVVLRRRLDPSRPRRPQSRMMFVDADRRVNLDEPAVIAAAAASQAKARFERWAYLTTDAYRLRYRLALGEVDHTGATVLEVGGFPNSIMDMVEHAGCVHLVEPYAPAAYVSRLEERAAAIGVGLFLHRATLANLNLDIGSLGRYRLVALGLDLTAGDEDEAALERAIAILIRLLCGAERSVVEIPRYRPSTILWEFLEGLLAPKRRFDVTLDFANDAVGEEYYVKDARAQRRLMVIERVRAVDLAAPEVRSAIAAAARGLAAAHTSITTPETPLYRIGEDVVFARGGNAEIYKRNGWVGAERAFAWSCTAASRLVLALDPETVAAVPAFRLAIELNPFVVAHKHETQRLGISVNGQEVLRGYPLSRLTELSVPLPRSVLLSQDPVVIRFDHPDCRRPADLIAGSKDMKELAFAFIRLAVIAEPNVDNPAAITERSAQGL